MATQVTTKLEGQPTWSRSRVLGHYGAAPDKMNSQTEARVPYAWVFYRELRAARGSAYRTVYDGEKTGLVHSENLALSRSEAARWRSADKIANNSLPVTSDERLFSWQQILGVEVSPTDTRHDIRLRCAAKYRANTGCSIRAVDEAVAQLLGDLFVRCWRYDGTDLDTPPSPTFPTYSPYTTGPVAYSLGGTAWLSARCHLLVEVQRPPTMSLQTFLERTNVQLFELLDALLPAWATFDWSTNVTGSGFLLDISSLDFDGMY